MFHRLNLLKCILDTNFYECRVCVCVCVCECTTYYLKHTKLTVQPARHSRHELGYRLDDPAHQGQNIFIFLNMSRINLGPNQCLIQHVPVGSFSGREKAVMAWNWPLTCTYCQCVEVYIYAPYMPPWQAQGKRFMLTAKPCSVFHQGYTSLFPADV